MAYLSVVAELVLDWAFFVNRTMMMITNTSVKTTRNVTTTLMLIVTVGNAFPSSAIVLVKLVVEEHSDSSNVEMTTGQCTSTLSNWAPKFNSSPDISHFSMNEANSRADTSLVYCVNTPNLIWKKTPIVYYGENN